jgi:hypothetical protein
MMKQNLLVFLFLLLIGTSPVYAAITALSPEEMISSAQFIVTGEVMEVRNHQEKPEFVVRVDTVYKGELGPTMLTVPLPPQPDNPKTAPQWMSPPEAGYRLLFFFTVNEMRRLEPVADLNWVAVLKDNKADSLYMGSDFNSWAEKDYLTTYNRFLRETEGIVIPPAEDSEGEDNAEVKRPGTVSPWIFFALAGGFFIVLVITGQRKKNL